ncbi:MAG: hypothetical protein NZ578_08825 [Candidatus Binatia bacterium]|nr:hypothetical protein [Candidatus Binatia bacterium]
MALKTTHGLAQMLENICQALRALPDENLLTLLHKLQSIEGSRARAHPARPPRALPLPPRDPREMEREELRAYLQSARYFPTKTDLLAFAKRYDVPANIHTPREEIIRLCIRIIHDIPRGFTLLRVLAVENEHPLLAPDHSVEASVHA